MDTTTSIYKYIEIGIFKAKQLDILLDIEIPGRDKATRKFSKSLPETYNSRLSATRLVQSPKIARLQSEFQKWIRLEILIYIDTVSLF
jgi:hypothetical protein